MSKQIGIDLGTSTTMIFVKDKGIVLRAPSVVSIDRTTHEVIASGKSAKRMIGKTPGNILALRPLKDGVITDLEVTSLMLHDFFTRLDMTSMFNRPSALVCIPYGVTEVERRAVEDAVFEAGAKNVGLIDEPIAAAVGAGIPVANARGSMLIDLGGGVSRKILSYGEQLMSVEVRFEKGAVGAMHTHPHVQISYVLEGSFEATIGEETKIIKKGDTYITDPDVPHGVVCLEAGALLDIFTPMRADFLK